MSTTINLSDALDDLGVQFQPDGGAFIKNDDTDSTPVRNIRRLTQAQYNALTPDANTLYIIIG